MKVRTAFVSNSSSSSFIVALDKKPESVEDVKKVFYPNGNGVFYEYGDYSPDKGELTAEQAAEKIYAQLKDQKAINKDQSLEEICAGQFEGIPDYDYNSNAPEYVFEREFHKRVGKAIQECNKTHPEEYKKWWNLLQEKWNKHDNDVRLAAERLYKDNEFKFKDKKVFVLSFGDSHGVEVSATMEHGNAFRNVPHLRISHH